MTKNKKIIFFILILISLTTNVYFRLYPITRNIKEKNISSARAAVYINLKNMLQENIEKTYPNITPTQKNIMLNTQLKLTIAQNKERIEKIIQETIKKKPLYNFYLLGADSYYYYYLAENLVSEGEYSPEIKEGRYYDPLMLAPSGYWRKIELHPYIGYWLYRLLKIFNDKISLMYTVSAIPLILIGITIIIFFFICIQLRINIFIAFLTSIFFGLSPILLQRSSFGWYDTDLYNVLFPLITTVIIFKLTQARKYNGIILSILAGIVSSIYSLFWQGWLALPLINIILISGIPIIVEEKPITRKFKKAAAYIFTYILSSIIMTILMLTPKGFFCSIKDFSRISSGFFYNINIWPDIFITVGELNMPSLRKLIHIMGGYLFFILAGIGLIATLYRIKKRGIPKDMLAKEIIVTILFISTLILAKNIERLSLFFLLPTSLYIGRSLNTLYKLLLKINVVNRVTYKKIIAISFLSVSLINPIIYAHISAKNQLPIFNKIWEKVLKEIKEISPTNSIITTWWCPGHFIKAIAKRRVTFDGATLNTPQAYWVARLFLTDDEKESIGILHMLNSSGNKAVEFLTKNNIPVNKAIKIILPILKMKKEDAKKFLVNTMSLPQRIADPLLEYTHGKPLPSYLLIYNELAENVLGLYYVKNWDFDKAHILKVKSNAIKNKKLLKRGTKENIALLWNIAGGKKYIGNVAYPIKTIGNRIFFNNGVVWDKTTNGIMVANKRNNLYGKPKSVIVTKEGKLKEITFPNYNLDNSVLIIRNNKDNSYSSIIAPADVLKSVLFRLYYLNGEGLTHFKKVISEENPLLQTKIIVFKVEF